jgi:hypothetical protein
LIVGAFYADPSGKKDAGRSYVIFGKTDNTAINIPAVDCCVVGFTEDDIGFACIYFTAWVGLMSTNNQIIQAIAVNIACGRD